jgi:hypothetical protein
VQKHAAVYLENAIVKRILRTAQVGTDETKFMVLTQQGEVLADNMNRWPS